MRIEDKMADDVQDTEMTEDLGFVPEYHNESCCLSITNVPNNVFENQDLKVRFLKRRSLACFAWHVWTSLESTISCTSDKILQYLRPYSHLNPLLDIIYPQNYCYYNNNVIVMIFAIGIQLKLTYFICSAISCLIWCFSRSNLASCSWHLMKQLQYHT